MGVETRSRSHTGSSTTSLSMSISPSPKLNGINPVEKHKENQVQLFPSVPSPPELPLQNTAYGGSTCVQSLPNSPQQRVHPMPSSPQQQGMFYYYTPTYNITANQYPANTSYQGQLQGVQSPPVVQANGHITYSPQASPQAIPIYVQPNATPRQGIQNQPQAVSPQANQTMVGGYSQVSMMPTSGPYVTYIYPCYPNQMANQMVYTDGYGSPMQYPTQQQNSYSGAGYAQMNMQGRKTSMYQPSPDNSGMVQQVGVRA